jgi:uncharacterized protein
LLSLCEAVERILLPDDIRMRALKAVQLLNLPDCWIGAGFVRDAIWDSLHGYPTSPPSNDVDVVWFDQQQIGIDEKLESELKTIDPDFIWSVKNQAMMHLRNADNPYLSVSHAMQSWPETATAIAVRLTYNGKLQVNAPFGLDDLFALKLRPTSAFKSQKRGLFLDRVVTKRWLSRYPNLQLEIPEDSAMLK